MGTCTVNGQRSGKYLEISIFERAAAWINSTTKRQPRGAQRHPAVSPSNSPCFFFRSFLRVPEAGCQLGAVEQGKEQILKGTATVVVVVAAAAAGDDISSVENIMPPKRKAASQHVEKCVSSQSFACNTRGCAVAVLTCCRARHGGSSPSLPPPGRTCRASAPAAGS
jgi:hypothetical protein